MKADIKGRFARRAGSAPPRRPGRPRIQGGPAIRVAHEDVEKFLRLIGFAGSKDSSRMEAAVAGMVLGGGEEDGHASVESMFVGGDKLAETVVGRAVLENRIRIAFCSKCGWDAEFFVRGE